MNDSLTKADIEKMRAEIEHRKLVVRPQLISEVKEARAQGDLSENFEYKAAKQAKNQNESRIRYLERMIKTARVFEDNSADDEVGVNNFVTVRFEEDGEEETYKIVSTVRVDSLSNLISFESPLGKAVMGHKEGDRVKVEVSQDSSYYVKILKIENNKDESEDRISSY
ncbi:MAG: transcription elongation factor GreA [Lachnospiraceae bacterium]|nr:transcription elongation factor GreA [Lachnospiraceae bacterium]MBQ6091597.1 transcription elongation factor GreA [Lachnospiraceae bacterium]MBR5369095.1 transcription elongation factor GreA [Lachnospiraceae bacterium]